MSIHEPLPRFKFREIAIAKGWRLADLASRWGISNSYLSRLMADRDRPTHWDDALRGLPTLSRAEAAELRRQRLAARPAPAVDEQRTVPRHGPGYSYHGALTPGAILVVVRELGELAQEGDEGVVVEVRDTGAGEDYRIRFDRGEEWFDEKLVEKYLAETGREDLARLTKP